MIERTDPPGRSEPDATWRSGAAVSRGSAMAQDDLVLTGEAVALEIPVASVGIRAVSGLIDVLLAIGLILIGTVLSAVISPVLDQALLAVVGILLVAGVLVGLPAALETLTGGRTLGKLITGLRAVRRDGGAISFRHSLVRSLVGVVEIYLLSGAPALFCALFSPRGQRIGDLVAGTYVVRDRFGLTLAPPLQCPPWLSSWARSADIADPPVALAVATRQFLRRAPGLDPASRQAVAVRLADSMLEYAAPPPPAGTAPEAFLAAVLAQRRERDTARLAAEVSGRRRLTGSPDHT